ncbi:MAG: hypothetical protein AUH30_08120 [Candidatus Rokubacteria bacterium 13_1_40CM_68_15]|nr:MAG: hypothetical protein AUH30_08120 [Candidatus Rokubacteria bacterium 13_1_40CM_68_15]
MIRFTLCVVALIALAVAVPAQAFDPNLTFQKGTWIASFEGGGGKQNDLENHGRQSDIELFYAGARISYLPWDTFAGGSFLYGTFEPGLEAIYQRYTKPQDKYYAGLALSGRYHFLSLGRFVPYIELLAAAGGTNLRVAEIDSDFAFWLAGGVGASFFVTDNVALYAGYRMIHVSNGHTKDPNRGFEADTGVAGVSFYFK